MRLKLIMRLTRTLKITQAALQRHRIYAGAIFFARCLHGRRRVWMKKKTLVGVEKRT